MSDALIGYRSLYNENIAFGYKALAHVIIGPNAGNGPGGELGYPPADDAPTTFWHCDYCGQSNAAEREGCRGCGAPRTEEPARTARERVTTWKGVPLSRLTEEEREEMREWMTGPDAWRYLPAALGL